MKPRCILFDVDGTLINTWDLYMEVYWRTLRHFQGDHITKEKVIAMRPTSELHFIRKNIGDDRLEDAHKVMMHYYERYHDELFGGIYRGVPELLQAVRNEAIAIGIVTGKSSHAWRITSSKVLLGEFNIIIVDDDVEHPKPHPHGIRQAVETVEAAPDETVYVGDTVSDFIAARDAGVRGLLVLWSKNDGEKQAFISRAEESGARDFFEHPDELVQALLH